MKRLVIAFIGFTLAGTAADADLAQPVITVASTAKVSAKADLAIVFLSTRSSAPLAADALEQNKKKVTEIAARLEALGYKGQQVKWSGHRFSPAGQSMYYGGGQRPTGFDVYSNLYVFLEGADLNSLADLNSKLGTLLDELSKLGAAPSSMPISPMSMGGASIVAFTVRDPASHEREAYQQAVEKARPIAEGIARRMKVQISGVASVFSSGFNRSMVAGPANPLDELPYEYISSSMDDVPVRVRLEVKYTYK